MHVQKITTPGGEELVIMPAQEFEDLVDVRDHAQAMAAYRRGGGEWLTDADMDDYLGAPSLLAFWRQRRKLTQAALAQTVGISQAYLAQIETGKRVGDVTLYRRLAQRLGVRIEDLLADEETR
jgi:DNA-binding XRE family transcriptional regulator